MKTILHYVQNPHVLAHCILLFPFVQLPLRLAFLHFLVDFTSLHFPTMRISEKEYIYSCKKQVIKIFKKIIRLTMSNLCIHQAHKIALRSIHHCHHIDMSLHHMYLSFQYILYSIHIYKCFHDKYPKQQSNRQQFGTLKLFHDVLKIMICTSRNYIQLLSHITGQNHYLPTHFPESQIGLSSGQSSLPSQYPTT